MKLSSHDNYLNAIELFKNRALAEYAKNINKMILFGSVARGDANVDSDIDILIVWDGNRFEGLRALGKIAFKILLDTEELISLKVVTPSDFEKLSRTKNRFILNVLAEGVPIVG